MGGGVFFPRRKHPFLRAADKRTDTERRDTEQREERSKTQIKEDLSSRSKEEPGLLRDTTSEGHNTS
jgi:hypothetical protein